MSAPLRFDCKSGFSCLILRTRLSAASKSCLNKPLKKVDEIIKNLKISAKKYPYALSDIVVWENIKSLWQQGVNTQIYNVDSPDSLRRGNIFDKEKYSFAVKKWLFWVFLYLREIYMTKNIKTVLDTYSLKKNPIVLIFLQSVHWEHVQYLLSNPSKDNIWQYYFGRFKYIKPTKEIGREIRKNSKVLGYYWDRHQKFY